MVDAFWLALVVTILIVGVNTLVWGAAGIGRLLASGWDAEHAGRPHPTPKQVAVLIPAHNEGSVIAQTIATARAQVPLKNIFVVSDGSTDDTAQVVRRSRVNLVELRTPHGKAGALDAAIRHFDLTARFEVVLLLDADTRLAPDYLQTGLPAFSDPEVVAVAGSARSLADPAPTGLAARILLAYRERVYVVMQHLQKFGQAAKNVNVVHIVPGFASMYRSSALEQIEINAPGLAIEDYNMTFEVHVRRLGKIAYSPRVARGYTQDPDTIRDYVRQVRRWNLGFFQTIRRHGWHWRRFWLALALVVGELVLTNLVVLLLVIVFAIAGIAALLATVGLDPTGSLARIEAMLPWQPLLLAFFIPDYLLTCITAFVRKRPSLLLLGFAFPLLRILDATIMWRALFAALVGSSSGSWVSPRRRVSGLERVESARA